jgi:hypothetical protein
MCYIKHSSSDNSIWEFNEDFPPMILGDVPINEIAAETLPCWSLAALLGILPSGKALIHDKESSQYKCICNNIGTPFYSNPVDACYEMIIKLHELNLL